MATTAPAQFTAAASSPEDSGTQEPRPEIWLNSDMSSAKAAPVEQQTPATGTRRLVVDLNRRSRADLDWLCDAEELNKTTVVNRAVQVYRRCLEAQINGGTVAINGDKVLFL